MADILEFKLSVVGVPPELLAAVVYEKCRREIPGFSGREPNGWFPGESLRNYKNEHIPAEIQEAFAASLPSEMVEVVEIICPSQDNFTFKRVYPAGAGESDIEYYIGLNKTRRVLSRKTLTLSDYVKSL